MPCYLITYDLNKETTRPPIVDKIKEIANGWAKLSESSYAINHAGSPQGVYNLLKPMLDSNDSLLVIPMHKPYYGQNSKAVIEWVEKSLPII